MTTKAFIIGVTGYIGGSVFTELKKSHPDFDFSALVRSPSDFTAVTAAGATPVKGSFSDHDTIVQHTSESDIVVSCAGATDSGLVEALLEGFRRRKTEGRPVGRLIHVGGTAVFSDGSKEGKFDANGKIWSDADVDDVKSIPGDPHRSIFDAAARGDVISYVIAPAAVHGPGTGPVRMSATFVKLVSNLYTVSGRAFYVGEGSNLFEFVHISDVVSLYSTVFKHALANKKVSTSPYERYYIAATESINWKTTASRIGAALYERGELPSSTPVSVTCDTAGPFASILASNVRTRAARGKEIGWNPLNIEFTV